MLFNTFEYLAFFSIVLVIAWTFHGAKSFRTWFILIASFYFYISNNHWAVFILLFTTTVDYFLSLKMSQTKSKLNKKIYLVLSIVSNIGVLAFFKYYNFLGANLLSFASVFGTKASWVDTNVILPVGISFYTFEALSYTIDVYRGHIHAEKRWNRLAFLVSFFPHLIAGPIVRATDFFPQMDKKPRLSVKDFEIACFLIIVGLIKKIIFADSLAPYVDAAFHDPKLISTTAAWLATYAFSFQVFFDFSGYTDIALGSALLLGFNLPQNFNQPYASISISDFWRRWHITLSTWLRDYLYISLGGSRKGTAKTCRNIMVTMFLGGLWHGASWNFALWGTLHGLFLSIERLIGINQNTREKLSSKRKIIYAFATFNIITLLWIPFRAKNFTDTKIIFNRMFVDIVPQAISPDMILPLALILFAWTWQQVAGRVPLFETTQRLPNWARGLLYACIAYGIVIFNSGPAKAFIYFKF